MSEADNTKVVQDAYAAFGRGDVQSILDRLDDGIVWQGVYGAASTHVNFTRFEPKEFVATGDKVVTLGHYTAKTSANKEFDSDFAMVFTMRNGKVTTFQEFLNTAALNAAF